MRHVLLIFFALVLVAIAGIVIWYNVHALTLPVLGFAGSCLVLAVGLAVPADFKEAIATVGPYIPFKKPQ